jgi:hypothetical protein
MSDYKDERFVQPTVILPHGLPYICGVYGEPANAVVTGDAIKFTTPLPRVYPRAWVSTPGAWSLVKMHSESEGRIVGEVFGQQWENIDTAGPAPLRHFP